MFGKIRSLTGIAFIFSAGSGVRNDERPTPKMIE